MVNEDLGQLTQSSDSSGRAHSGCRTPSQVGQPHVSPGIARCPLVGQNPWWVLRSENRSFNPAGLPWT